MAIAVLTVMVLQYVAPEAGRLAPRWIIPAFELVLLLTLIVVDPGRIDKRSAFMRRATTTLIGLMTFATLAGVTSGRPG